jgi:hypothetical protein
MVAALLLAVAIAAPTPSPTLSPLPSAQVNYYAAKGAQSSGLDVALVRSVIENESAGDPHAVSGAGAVGLMQLEPETASDCGFQNRFDALQNVICGSKTLSYLVRSYGLRSAIAAYNWGASNVSAHPTESAWPAETRTYVAAVLARYDTLQHQALPIATPEPDPTPSPTSLTFSQSDGPGYSYSLVPTAVNPCNHRWFCGPIRLLPTSVEGRRALLVDIGLAVFDGILTRNGTGGNPAYEADPVVRPFIRGGLPSMAAGWLSLALLRSSLAHSAHIDPGWTTWYEAGQHLAGIASWLSPRTYAFGLIRSSYQTPVVEDAWIRHNAIYGSCR